MNRQDAEKIISEFLKPIFGFTLKRCKNLPDAEDLSQDIVLKAFKALTIKDDIEDAGKFIWTIAHNSLANYYRSTAKISVGVPLDELSEIIPDPDSFSELDETKEAIARLQNEIAYLSKLQRRIVIAFYFENQKQDAIAKELNIPLGTVKWHLFEAKKELKRGMDTMRKTSELKFNPIKFNSVGINGTIGTKTTDEFFRTALSQNICYSVRNTAKTVNEIADDLGVSPVYVESEAEFLEKYGFLKESKGRYILNFIISEPTAELLTMQDKMYKRAAKLFANDLYDELTSSGLLNDGGIWCGQTDEPIKLTESARADRNFLLWTLIPYIAACSGEKLMDDKISFNEVATIRPDGAHNIAHASVTPNDLVLPDDYVYMKNWCGPYSEVIPNKKFALWKIDSEWSGRRLFVSPRDREISERVLSLFEREDEDGMLSKDDYSWLAEQGYIKTNGDYDGHFKSSWQVVILANKEIKARLLDVGNKLKEKHKAEFDAIKVPYAEAVLNSVSTHLRKVKEYELQFVFHSDGWFILHCLKALLDNGKLKPPTEGQKKSLTTLIIPNK